MKTPREILFARHQATAPKLDAIRREVVTELNRHDAKAQTVIMRKLQRRSQSVAQVSSPASSGIVPMPGTKRGGTPLKLAAGTAALHYFRGAMVTLNTLAAWLQGCFSKLWLELVWPCRRIWTGLATVWVLLFIFNLSQRDPSERLARNTKPPSPDMILTFRQEQRLLAELIGTTDTGDTERRKIYLPKPRTEHVELLTA